MTRHDATLARKLYQSNSDLIRSSLPDLGESLPAAAVDLARDCTLERVDKMLSRLRGAETSLLHLRRSLAEQKS
jgi:Arc/MetJ-type ribon-helix-helix transcriptional regulator